MLHTGSQEYHTVNHFHSHLTALLCVLSVHWTYFKPALKIFSRRPVVVSSQIQGSRESSVCRERRPGTLCPWQRTAGPSTPPRSQRSLRWGLSPRRHQLRKTRKRVSFLCIYKYAHGIQAHCPLSSVPHCSHHMKTWLTLATALRSE